MNRKFFSIMSATIILFTIAGLRGCANSQHQFFNRNHVSDYVQDGRFYLTDEGVASWMNDWLRGQRFSCHNFAEMPDIQNDLIAVIEGNYIRLWNGSNMPFQRTENFYTAHSSESSNRVYFSFYGDIMNVLWIRQLRGQRNWNLQFERHN